MMRVAALLAAVGLGLGSLCYAGEGKPDIFVGDDPVAISLKAPFADLFARARSNADYRVDGTLTWSAGSTTATIDGIRISERGHTSRQTSECEFPKLKIDFDDVRTSGTPFSGIRSLKIGTHCGDRPVDELTRRYGRVANEQSPAREAMVYRMLEAAGVPTLLARTARVTYVFTDQPDRKPLTRLALLLEDDAEARTRVGASGELTEETFRSARELLEPHDTARLVFAEAMIGNFDWCLRMFGGDIYRCDDRHPVWNVLAFQRRGQRALPLIYDFDLSGPVVGRHVWFEQVFSAGFTDPPSPVRAEVEAQVQRARSLFDRALLDETRRHFLNVRAAISDAIARSAADERGKDQARGYVGAFYDAIENDQAFYRPVVVGGGHQPWQDADRSQPACPDGSVVPVGTPVSAPIEVRGDLTRVRILDALWAWTGPNRCDSVHRQPVWIPSDAIGTDYPR